MLRDTRFDLLLESYNIVLRSFIFRPRNLLTDGGPSSAPELPAASRGYHSVQGVFGG
jgi:hypothetical protein